MGEIKFPISMTQLINTYRRVQDNNGTNFLLSSGRAYVCDDYPNATVGKGFVNDDSLEDIGDSSTQSSAADDTPRQEVTDNYQHVRANDGFCVYLMYKPTGADSIWVTLRTLKWYWSGSGTRGVNWSIVPNSVSIPAANPTSSDSTDLPLWNDYFTDLQLLQR